MKGLLILAAVVLLAALLGWLSFGNSDDSATMTIDKQEVRQDTEAAMEESEGGRRRGQAEDSGGR